MNQYILDKITNTLLDKLKQGKIPWHKTWQCDHQNGVTHRPYHGVNVLLTSWSGHEHPYWYTFNQVRQLGATVRKGETNTTLVHFSMVEKKDDTTGEVIATYPKWSAWQMFNHEQTTLPNCKVEAPIPVPIDEIKRGYKDCPDLITGTHAAYNFKEDKLVMPEPKRFDSPEAYGAVLFHEMVHSTGHERRLNRNLQTKDLNEYSLEELVAEIGACYLCHKAGIQTATERNTVAYLQSWLKQLQDNPEWIITAAAKAQVATNYILGDDAYAKQKVA